MEWTQFVIFLVTIGGMFFWNRSESRSDHRNLEAWTKEILKEIGISKVKLSRKIRSLEKKELIKKVPYGNENKIKLTKN